MDAKVNNSANNPKLGSDFTGATNRPRDYYLKLNANIKLLLEGLSQYKTKDSLNNQEAAEDIKDKLKQFLLGCEFHMALADFEETLKESKTRNDGSIGWYHQLTPVLILISMVQDETINLNDLDKYGGLETSIRIALRHDSIEDFGKDFEKFEEDQKQKIEITLKNLRDTGLVTDIGTRRAEELNNLQLLMNGLRLMTKKVAVLDQEGNPQYHENGKMIKKSLFDNTSDYTHNMVEAEYASPVVWILKVCDSCHNLASMIGAPKFTAERRLEYANQREDMYGSRDGLPEIAMKKWPEFKKAIKRVDHLMGSILYTNFGYLEYVDQDAAYPEANGKFRDGGIVRLLGIDKYLQETLKIKIPTGLNPFNNLLESIETQTKTESDPTLSRRIDNFWKLSLFPVLENYKKHFSVIFKKNQSININPHGATFAPHSN